VEEHAEQGIHAQASGERLSQSTRRLRRMRNAAIDCSEMRHAGGAPSRRAFRVLRMSFHRHARTPGFDPRRQARRTSLGPEQHTLWLREPACARTSSPERMARHRRAQSGDRSTFSAT
jgi:hypothetical protein